MKIAITAMELMVMEDMVVVVAMVLMNMMIKMYWQSTVMPECITYVYRFWTLK
jgi:hypothetical protein